MMFRAGLVLGCVAAALLIAATSVEVAFAHGKSQFPKVVPYRADLMASGLPSAALSNSIPDTEFVNFETPHVHPLDLNGNTLVAVNTADNHLEVFDVSSGVPVHVISIPVGIDPVSARFNNFDTNEVWVVNQVSDSVSIVNLTLGAVVRTLRTADEPADVVFTNYDRPAYVALQAAIVSCSRFD